jgi:putative SOS response-associated peptidase YedK
VSVSRRWVVSYSLYCSEGGDFVMCIVTTEANEMVAEIHDRMLAILAPHALAQR